MNFHQLSVFYVVVQRRSITAAAAELRLTQPAVSLQIRALEKECGLALFERGVSGQARMRLTQAGEALYRSAVSILHTLDETRRVMGELGAATKGKLILGANTTGGMYLLPRIVRAFKEQYPETEIVFQIDATERLYESTLQNVLDMALVGGPTQDRRFGVDQVCLDNVVLIASPSHPFARRRSVTLRELGTEPCVLPQQGSRTRALVERKTKAAGVTLCVVMQLQGTEAVKKAVEANLGIGFVSSYAVEREAATGVLALVPIERFELSRHMELIYRKQKYFSPVAQRFREFVGEFAQQITPIRAEMPPSRRAGHQSGR
ncbi:MAG: LysR family transcriptional regulator [Acidobacteria bacterium]|nr:LysR family transcriptional regulator [Acidobacteriota bacterium]